MLRRLTARLSVSVPRKNSQQVSQDFSAREASITTSQPAGAATIACADRFCMFCFSTSEEEGIIVSTSRCRHEPDVCQDCLVRYLHSQIDNKTLVRLRRLAEGPLVAGDTDHLCIYVADICWVYRGQMNIQCPTFGCKLTITARSIRLVSPLIADELDTRQSIAALQTLPNFRWCAHDCGSGQVSPQPPSTTGPLVQLAGFEGLAAQSAACLRRSTGAQGSKLASAGSNRG